jgi:hypothetical protein
MTDVYKNLRGTTESGLHINGPDGAQIMESSGVLSTKNSDNSAYAKLRVADVPTSSSDLHDTINLLNLRGRVADIEFSFDGGGVVPSPGANTSKFGICHTTGGSYTAGDVVFDTGTALQLMPANVVTHLTTRTVITGGISFIANGLYARQGAGWILKGDGTPSYAGVVRSIEVTYGTTTPVVSTTVIEEGARVTEVVNEVTEVFDGTTPSLVVSIEGSSPVTVMSASQSKLKKLGIYVADQYTDIDSVGTGVVQIAITLAGSSNGGGRVRVTYVVPLA